MSFATIINVVIGLIFIWMILSLVIMQVQEWFAAKMQWRAKMLETTIRNLLGDPVLADQLYNHPLVRSLFTGMDGATKPSYIPANQFALALFDIVMTSGSEASLLQQQVYKLRWETSSLSKRQQKSAQMRLNLILALVRRALVAETDEATSSAALEGVKFELEKFANDFSQLKNAVNAALNNVQVQKEQMAALGILPQTGKMASEIAPSTLNRMRAGIAAMSITHPRLKQTLHALLVGVEDGNQTNESVLTFARENVETWFNNAMDRLSGWYKRRVQITAFILGLLVALVVNADSITLASQLWREPLVREALAAQAGTVVAQSDGQESVDLQSLLSSSQSFASISLTLGWIGSPKLEDADGESSLICTFTPQSADDVFGLDVAGVCYPIINAPHPVDISGWVQKLLGLLVTALAAAQGAPFWFDILKKIINVRSAGLNPSEAMKKVG